MKEKTARETWRHFARLYPGSRFERPMRFPGTISCDNDGAFMETFEENAIPIRVPLRVPLFAALLGRLVYLGVDIRPLQARGKTRAR